MTRDSSRALELSPIRLPLQRRLTTLGLASEGSNGRGIVWRAYGLWRFGEPDCPREGNQSPEGDVGRGVCPKTAGVSGANGRAATATRRTQSDEMGLRASHDQGRKNRLSRRHSGWQDCLLSAAGLQPDSEGGCACSAPTDAEWRYRP